MKMANVFANPILVGMTTEGDIHVPTRRSFPFSRCAITRLLLEILDDLYGCMVCILFVLFSLEFLQCYDVLCFFFLFSDTFECRSTGACTECVNVAFRWRRIKHFLYLTMTSLALILMKQILKMILRNSDRSAIAVWITASPFLTWDPRFREVGNPPAVSRTAPLQRSAVKNQRVFCLWAAARCIHSTATPAVPSKSKQQTLKINRDQDKAIDIPEKISFGCITENTFGCDLAASENEAWLKMADVDSDSEGRLDRAEPNCYSLRLLVDLHKTSPCRHDDFTGPILSCPLILFIGCCSLVLTQTWPNCFTRNNVGAWGWFHFWEISFRNTCFLEVRPDGAPFIEALSGIKISNCQDGTWRVNIF